MPEQDIEKRHLEQAARHVGELEQQIGQQEAMVTTLDRDGHDTTEALRLLQAFRDLLIQARIHQTRIVERLAGKNSAS